MSQILISKMPSETLNLYYDLKFDENLLSQIIEVRSFLNRR
jgi:hypothetical protein